MKKRAQLLSTLMAASMMAGALSGCGSTDETAYRIGIVQQDVFLFADTILENIRYGRPGASDEEVERVKADLPISKEFITREEVAEILAALDTPDLVRQKKTSEA